MTNVITGSISLATLPLMKTAMQWFQTNYPTELRLEADGTALSVRYSFSVVDLNAGIDAITAVIGQYPAAVWNAILQ